MKMGFLLKSSFDLKISWKHVNIEWHNSFGATKKPCANRANNFHSSASDLMARRWKQEQPFQSELQNPVQVVYGGEKKAPEDVGVVFDKKPFKVSLGRMAFCAHWSFG